MSEEIKIYLVPELAKLLQVTERTILNYLRKGKMKGVKAGHHWVVTENNLKAFLAGE